MHKIKQEAKFTPSVLAKHKLADLLARQGTRKTAAFPRKISPSSWLFLTCKHVLS